MKAGDHLRVLKDGVWDHAIDAGDRTVIRWVPRLGVLRSGLGEFVAGAERGEVVVHRERTFKPREVVSRAFSRFAETAYSAMFHSPEQFALWCKNGRLPAAPPASTAPKRAGARAAPKPAGRAAVRAGPAAKKAAKREPARRAARKAAPRKPAARKAAKAKPTARKAAPRRAAPKVAVRRPAARRAAGRKKPAARARR